MGDLGGRGKKRGEVGYGMGDTITIRRQDVLGGNPNKKVDPLDHPLFKGVGEGTRERLRDAIQPAALRNGKRLTHHAVEEGANSPVNGLYLSTDSPLIVRLHRLGTNPDRKPGASLGEPVELDVSNLRSWFGRATHVPTQPGLTVTAEGPTQKANFLRSLSHFYNPDRPDEGILTEDVERLLMNTAGIFSKLLRSDNGDEAVATEGFTPHPLAGLTDGELEALIRLRGIRHTRIEVNKPFDPGQLSLKEPHALLISGQGMFFNRSNVRDGYEHPLARIGDIEMNVSAHAFAFQWAALNPANQAGAVFVPTERTSVITIPTTGNLDLLHRAVDSIAASAASMREHVVSEAQRLEAEKPFSERLKGLFRGWGILS